jgi:hypothetical protein
MTAESTYISLLCALIGGAEPESAHFFDVYGYQRPRYIRVDCETPTHVIEVGLDERASSRDSVHQAALAAAFTGKRPMVVLIDTDGREGRYELEMRLVTEHLGVDYVTCSAHFLERWAATAPFRDETGRDLADLPDDPTIASHCRIGPLLEGADLPSDFLLTPG